MSVGSVILPMLEPMKVFYMWQRSLICSHVELLVGQWNKNIDRHLVIKALMMAVWARQPTQTVLVHSDQGSQYGSADYLAFMKANNLQPSMESQRQLS